MDAVFAAIEVQADALRGIRRASGYQTDLGLAVIYPHQPSGEAPAQCVFRAGPIGFANARPEIVRATATWAAIVIAEPGDIDERGLEAQSDLVRALRGGCPAATVERVDLPARDLGANSIVVAVNCTVGVPEPDPV